MPPVVFTSPADPSMSTWSSGLGSMSVLTPPSAKAGDLLVLAIGLRSAAASVATVDGDAAFAGWTLIQTLATAHNKLYLFTRLCDDEDIGTHSATFDVGTAGQAGLIALRGVDSIPASGAATDVVASTNFPCPAQTIAKRADAYLAIIISDVVAAAVPVPPFGIVWELNDTDGIVGIEMIVMLSSAVGATSATGTVGSNRSGIAASFLLSGDALALANDLSFTLLPSGAIGLPMEGV